ncbi:UDP-N-acetylglucosamine--N-acetylmuramyl-(pentapeptide) pyrophosphoryl-undecaprenol N-acetylglucosamine transferase [Candidatus Jorgensenbacteria bacterium CG_4_8_14_3_um_filter_38_10]|uniref:UDP-N-acetylglucosamine--N-acetylmuramyl-(pentapeptide) pyrophosphoryl-undecaprenol N-acetylglucosamine transferase n=1 Tax=Candidatus Jorgensenbacteria bacterium CG11_big_fil_rev_8_21_14_0_20_38_23 TaxID=1974594 RepID=A0A2H0NDC8_9BACT|nr:MAG: UDP-N-acetylglucosamine--N-acetylmuramyl-(pentapeptide) pyrophosphoryl-undecaprenol N-acetylglucosamine transferase [Candidatus Jorgensenbacteria bacterium CG11_big_fil_rev_8_21_14_0_20_38_23]PIV13406.1 MAG: UDP-N-acetylglucosamine--N-acetylmuramyl-(pentapeptide) pyrophosphoryl-undecaprenol N-acetylglucosamine transferase [Candidatus Jorgensenbacteria bacterium CG03_land_8_20_14_0_80_38_39]PIW97632.1 MAG: UDP-N-acetylglucosamine--N-acetylmuramyl-(pentapeptide) pyrophosphoryl-undecaprenol 
MALKKIKILLTGGGTGGHIYPLIAVADSLIKITKESVEIFYLGPENPLNNEFKERGIKVYKILSSKLRRYFDLANFLDIPKFFLSCFQTLWRLYWLMPDVVFSKGGPGALAVILAAKFYFIPVIIHESDAIPGLTNKISSHFAKRIGISFKRTASFFPASKTALVGHPLRPTVLPEQAIGKEAAKQFLSFDVNIPLLLVLGGSQGSTRINNFIINNLDKLLPLAQIYHQTGKNNYQEALAASGEVLRNIDQSFHSRYHLVDFLDSMKLRDSLAAADLVISRAGAGTIFEIAAFGKPSILIPLPEAASHHQLFNAYDYAESGAAVVIEEANLKINIVLNQIQKILFSSQNISSMAEAARSFARPQAAEIIAREILKLGF